MSGTDDDEVSATVAAVNGSVSVVSSRAALGRTIRITAEAVLEALGQSDSDEDDYDGAYHRPMEVLESEADLERTMAMTIRGRAFSMAPRKIVEIDQSYVERWDMSSPAALEFLRSELKIDQKLKAKSNRDSTPSGKTTLTSSQSSPSSFLGIAPSASLPLASIQEIAALEKRCTDLLTATGIAEDAIEGTFEKDVVSLHKRIQLLDSLYAEEMSNRCDATVMALKRRSTSKMALLALVGDTNADQSKMHQLKELTKVVSDAYNGVHGALQVVGRMQTMRGVHQEAYFRATTFAEITEEMNLCDELLKAAPEEIEEMKPMVADIGLAVKESLAAFRERIKAIPTRNVTHL